MKSGNNNNNKCGIWIIGLVCTLLMSNLFLSLKRRNHLDRVHSENMLTLMREKSVRRDSLARLIFNKTNYSPVNIEIDSLPFTSPNKKKVSDGESFWREHELLATQRPEETRAYTPVTRKQYSEAFELVKGLSPEEAKGYVFAAYFKFNYHTPDYLKGLLALIASYRSVRSKFGFLVYTVEAMPECVNEALKKLGVEIVVLDPLITKSGLLDGPWRSSFDKLVAWKLTKYKRMVLLDTDTMMVANADELMGFPELTASLDYCFGCVAGDNINAGVVVIQPNIDSYKNMQEYATNEKSCLSRTFKWFDQELLICLYSKMFVALRHHIGQIFQLPYIYNAKPALSACRGKSGTGRWVSWRTEEVKIVHFICVEKPWILASITGLMTKRYPTINEQMYITWNSFFKQALKTIGVNKYEEIFDESTSKLIEQRVGEYKEMLKKQEEEKKTTFDSEDQDEQRKRIAENREKIQEERKAALIEKAKLEREARLKQEKDRIEELAKMREQRREEAKLEYQKRMEQRQKELEERRKLLLGKK